VEAVFRQVLVIPGGLHAHQPDETEAQQRGGLDEGLLDVREARSDGKIGHISLEEL